MGRTAVRPYRNRDGGVDARCSARATWWGGCGRCWTSVTADRGARCAARSARRCCDAAITAAVERAVRRSGGGGAGRGTGAGTAAADAGRDHGGSGGGGRERGGAGAPAGGTAGGDGSGSAATRSARGRGERVFRVLTDLPHPRPSPRSRRGEKTKGMAQTQRSLKTQRERKTWQVTNTYLESDGKSVAVTLSATVDKNQVAYVEGWLGIANQDGVSGDVITLVGGWARVPVHCAVGAVGEQGRDGLRGCDRPDRAYPRRHGLLHGDGIRTGWRCSRRRRRRTATTS